MFTQPGKGRKGTMASTRSAGYDPHMPAPVRSEVDLRARHTVETPEHVTLAWEVAGLGSRSIAALLDHALLFAALVAASQLGDALGIVLGGWGSALEVLVSFAIVQGYFIAFESLWQGQTPGKRLAGIRVVRVTGHPAGIGAVVVRNLVRTADLLLPPPYLTGMLLLLFHPRSQRLGDLAAGTLVVRERPVPAPRPADLPSAPSLTSPLAASARLSAEEFRLLENFHARSAALDPEVRARLGSQLAARFAARFPERPAAPDQFLESLYQAERAARAEGRGTSVRERALHRLVTRQEKRWAEFEALATRASAQGLDSFAAAELPDYAARYREVASDLARARTYGAEGALLARLERLATAGHNTLYRDTGRAASGLWQYLFRDAPAAVIREWRAVLLAFLTFAAPGVAGYVLLREEPASAYSMLPDVVLERAAAAEARQAEGRGYFEAENKDQPVMATGIMTNNIRVALNCFVGGLVAGVGALALLAYNGLAIGAISGHFANVGQLGYLWTFVIGHGVVELFAIWVAGAAGFLLGLALLAPGDRTRSEALEQAGRDALPMVAAVVVLLVLAGLIEGFVSASTVPLAARLAVSGASLVFLVLYLANGWRARLRAAEPGPGEGLSSP
jgi:uncharacterized membrane protein SpoIIM required for sporulation/uncharacterized RDD family membrane protein YckC